MKKKQTKKTVLSYLTFLKGNSALEGEFNCLEHLIESLGYDVDDKEDLNNTVVLKLFSDYTTQRMKCTYTPSKITITD